MKLKKGWNSMDSINMILEREQWVALVNTEVVQQARLHTLRRILSTWDYQKGLSPMVLVSWPDRHTDRQTDRQTDCM